MRVVNVTLALDGLPAACRCDGLIWASHIGYKWCWQSELGECEDWGGEEEKGAAIYRAKPGRNCAYLFHFKREGTFHYQLIPIRECQMI